MERTFGTQVSMGEVASVRLLRSVRVSTAHIGKYKYAIRPTIQKPPITVIRESRSRRPEGRPFATAVGSATSSLLIWSIPASTAGSSWCGSRVQSCTEERGVSTLLQNMALNAVIQTQKGTTGAWPCQSHQNVKTRLPLVDVSVGQCGRNNTQRELRTTCDYRNALRAVTQTQSGDEYTGAHAGGSTTDYVFQGRKEGTQHECENPETR